MESVFFKKRIWTMVFGGAIVSITLLGFQAEPIEANSSLEHQWTGHWEVTSFQHDGADIQGEIVVSSKLHFRSGLSGSIGDFEWSIVYHGNDAFETITGSYEINESLQEIAFTGHRGKQLEMHYELHDDQLELSGMHDDMPLLLKAQRVDQSMQK
jgi:hypothetical protein